jgi:uncharacterized RDD family membrane protein YckC
VTGAIRNERSRSAQGSRAGFVSQVVGAVLDFLLILAVDFGLLAVFGFVRFLVTDRGMEMPQPGPVFNAVIIWSVAVVLLSSAWSGSGRAPGMAVVGIRVVTDRSTALSSGRAFWRAVLVATTLGLGLVTVAFSRRNKSLYDMICKTAVVYDWRARLAESRQDQ